MMMQDFIKQFGDLEMDHLLTLRKNVFMTNADMIEIIAKVKKRTHLDPIYAGEFLGTQDKQFHASPLLLDRLAPLTDKRVTVDDKSAYLFLCGRDILAGSIVAQDISPHYKGQVLVLNEKKEVLGLGTLQRESREGMVVKNIFDRGDFLRREGIKKKQLHAVEEE